MNKNKLTNLILFCGIFLWLIPSALFNERDKIIVIFYYGFHLTVFLLYVIQFFMSFKQKRSLRYEWILIYISVVGSVLVHIITYVTLLIQGQESSIKLIPAILVVRGIVIIYIIIYRYSCYEKSDFDKKLEKEKELKIKVNKNKVKKKSSKKWIFKLLLEDFKANFKNYIVFIVSAVLTVTYVYGFLGNLFIIQNMQQISMAYIGEGAAHIVLNALIVITIITIIIQFYALKNYIQNRMYDFKTLMLLGMKQKDIYKCMGILIGISLLISYVIGAILGNGMIFIFRKVYGAYLQNNNIPQVNIVNVAIISFILCVIVLGFIMSVVQDIAIESSIMNVSDTSMEEKIIKCRKIIFILPILLIIFMKFYCDPHWAESKYIVYPSIIIFLVFAYYAFSYIIEKLKNENKISRRNILTLNLMFYKSRSYLKNSLLLYTLIFVIFSNYIFQIATLFPLNTSNLYPYDYVCLGYEEDKNELENIEKEFDVQSKTYPVIRVTVPGGEDGGYGSFYKTLPIGHHLGISESTYKSLSGKSMNLEGKETIILYQEDKSNKAHPLDFYADREKPLIKLGQAQMYSFIMRRTLFNLDYDLVDERREIVLGRLSDIMFENIVVFSDEYFNTHYEQVDGIKYLTTINSNMENNKKLESYLDSYEKTHKKEQEFDKRVKSVYRANVLNKDFQGEKIFILIINISILLTFTVASIIIIFVHAFGNISYYKNRYEILSYLGEKIKNSNKIIKKEVMLFSLIPCILAIFTSLIFNLITVNMRGFNYMEIITSGKVYLGMTLTFLLVYSGAAFLISQFLIKDIGGRK